MRSFTASFSSSSSGPIVMTLAWQCRTQLGILPAVVRKGHRLSGSPSIAPADLSGEVVWGSFAAPVARHYLAIKDLLEERGADMGMYWQG